MHKKTFQYNVPVDNQYWPDTSFYLEVEATDWREDELIGDLVPFQIKVLNLDMITVPKVKDWRIVLADLNTLAEHHFSMLEPVAGS